MAFKGVDVVTATATTTTATTTTILTYAVPTESVVYVDAKVIGKISAGNSYGYNIARAIKRAGSGNTVFVAGTQVKQPFEDGTASSFDANIQISSTNFIIQVTTPASTLNWLVIATVTILQP